MRNTGDRLKEFRIMKGLSRGEMSEMLNVSTDYLARLETAKSRTARWSATWKTPTPPSCMS